MPFGSERKSAAEWAHIEEIESDKLKVMCKHCTDLISKKIERGRAHLRKCNNLTIRGKCFEDEEDFGDTSMADSATRDSTSSR